MVEVRPKPRHATTACGAPGAWRLESETMTSRRHEIEEGFLTAFGMTGQ